MYTYEKCQSYMLGRRRKKQVGLEWVALWLPSSFCVTRYWKKVKHGDGINDRRCFYICKQILVVALSAIFSYVYLFDIIFSVGLHSCHPIDHWPTYQAFFKRRYLGLRSKCWVYQSFKQGFIIKHWQVNSSWHFFFCLSFPFSAFSFWFVFNRASHDFFFF